MNNRDYAEGLAEMICDHTTAEWLPIFAALDRRDLTEAGRLLNLWRHEYCTALESDSGDDCSDVIAQDRLDRARDMQAAL